MRTKPPSSNESKARSRSFLRKHQRLVVEIETMWDREIPTQQAETIQWSLLESLANDLSSRLSPPLLAELHLSIKERSMLRYIRAGSQYGVPQMHETPGRYLAAAVILNLFKKFPSTTGEFDPLSTATARLYEAETQCRITNRRLRWYRKFDFSSRPICNRLGLHWILHSARRKIESWIGPFSLDKVTTEVRHGPGGCVGLSRPFTTPYYKFSEGNYTVSIGAYWPAVKLIASSDAWVRALCENRGLVTPLTQGDVKCIPTFTKWKLVDDRMTIVNYNKVTFVLKTIVTHRAIATEPLVNVALQLDVGGYFKKCLKAAGCDLTDQTRNQELAYIGSIQHEPTDPVTIDERMASDTECIECVRELFPEKWFEYLDSIRSHEGRLNGKVIKWEKFSSMGNGFTFELESMIFYALAQSVSDYLGTTSWFTDTFGPAYSYAYVSVYGDDIIVPQEVAGHLIEVLSFFGFKSNLDKTFIKGPFRESCGEDFFGGVQVRPFYLERPLSKQKDLIHLANNLRLLEEKVPMLPLTESRKYVEGLISPVLKKNLVGPHRTKGDTHLWVSPDECHRSKLVVFDIHEQTWVYPYMRQQLDIQKGLLFWKYVQFLYSNTGTREPVTRLLPATDDLATLNGSRDLRATLTVHKDSGGSAGDVVLSGQTGQGLLCLTTLN